MTTWKYVKDWVEVNSSVKDWAIGTWPNDAQEKYRADYVYNLKRVCEGLQIQPEKLLAFLERKPCELFKRTKQLLTTESQKYYRKAHLEKAAIQSYLRFHDASPEKFTLSIALKNRRKYSRPLWGVKELEKILMNVHRKYRPLIKLGAYAGLGRKELCYLNEHYLEAKPVPGVPEAVYLSEMPVRKSNEEKWTAILPREEFEEFTKHAPVRSFRLGGKDRLVSVEDLTANFKNACLKAEIREEGTGIHVLRAIFMSMGRSQPPGPNIDEDILDMNMGHNIDSEKYNRLSQQFDVRAKSLIPLWMYMRHGAPVASSNEVKKLEDQLRQQTQTIALMNIAIQQLQQAGKKTA